MDNGEQFVTTVGISGMPLLHVVNSDITMPPEHFQEARYRRVLGGYGWTESDVQDAKTDCAIATIVVGEGITVAIIKTLELNALRQVY